MIKRVNGIKGLWRGDRPTFENLQQYKKNGITVVYNLENDDEAVEQERKWCEELGLKFYHFPLSGLWAPEKKNLKYIVAALYLLLAAGYVVFLHCLHGVDRTGIVVARCQVSLYDWTVDKAWREFFKEGHHRAMWFVGWNKSLLT